MRLPYLLLFTLFLGSALGAKNKWRICSMTMNSSNELEVFKKNLPNKTFEFIELTDFNPKQNKEKSDDFQSEAWFENACQDSSVPSCDMLIISGHFTPYGRIFYGEDKQFELSLETMLKHRCSQSCEKILSRPAEIFLFGCNTLNNECKTMTYEEKQMKIAEFENQGLPREEATQIVETLSMSSMQSVKTDMKGSFEGVKSIHGFDDIAPSGFTIEKSLDKAVNLVIKEHGGYDKYLEKILLKTSMGDSEANYFNPIYDKCLRQELGSAYTFTSGYDGVITEEDEIRVKIKGNICQIINEKFSPLQRADFIRELNEKGELLYYINFVSKIFKSDFQNTEEGAELIRELKAQESLKSQVLSFINMMSFGVVLVDTLDFAQVMGWMSSEEANQKRKDALTNIMNLNRITSGDMELVCSLARSGKLGKIEDMKFALNQDHLRHLEYPEGIETFKCLKIKGEGIAQKLNENIRKRTDFDYIKASFNYLVSLDNSEGQFKELINHLISLNKKKITEFALTKLENAPEHIVKESEEILISLINHNRYQEKVLMILSRIGLLKQETKEKIFSHLEKIFLLVKRNGDSRNEDRERDIMDVLLNMDINLKGTSFYESIKHRYREIVLLTNEKNYHLSKQMLHSLGIKMGISYDELNTYFNVKENFHLFIPQSYKTGLVKTFENRAYEIFKELIKRKELSKEDARQLLTALPYYRDAKEIDLKYIYDLILYINDKDFKISLRKEFEYLFQNPFENNKTNNEFFSVFFKHQSEEEQSSFLGNFLYDREDFFPLNDNNIKALGDNLLLKNSRIMFYLFDTNSTFKTRNKQRLAEYILFEKKYEDTEQKTIMLNDIKALFEYYLEMGNDTGEYLKRVLKSEFVQKSRDREYKIKIILNLALEKRDKLSDEEKLFLLKEVETDVFQSEVDMFYEFLELTRTQDIKYQKEVFYMMLNEFKNKLGYNRPFNHLNNFFQKNENKEIKEYILETIFSDEIQYRDNTQKAQSILSFLPLFFDLEESKRERQVKFIVENLPTSTFKENRTYVQSLLKKLILTSESWKQYVINLYQKMGHDDFSLFFSEENLGRIWPKEKRSDIKKRHSLIYEIVKK